MSNNYYIPSCKRIFCWFVSYALLNDIETWIIIAIAVPCRQWRKSIKCDSSGFKYSYAKVTHVEQSIFFFFAVLFDIDNKRTLVKYYRQKNRVYCVAYFLNVDFLSVSKHNRVCVLSAPCFAADIGSAVWWMHIRKTRKICFGFLLHIRGVYN